MKFESKELKKLIEESGIKSTETLRDLLRDLTKKIIDTVYNREITHQLGYKKHDQVNCKTSSRNGYGS